FNARQEVDRGLASQSQALPRGSPLQRRVSSCRVLFARAGKNGAGQEVSVERSGRIAERANLLLQHGLLRRAARESQIGAGPSPHQFQNGSIFSRNCEEGSGPGFSQGTSLKRQGAAVS